MRLPRRQVQMNRLRFCTAFSAHVTFSALDLYPTQRSEEKNDYADTKPTNAFRDLANAGSGDNCWPQIVVPIDKSQPSQTVNERPEPSIRRTGSRRAKTINDLREYMTMLEKQETERKGDAASHCMVTLIRLIFKV